jgi:DNA polymerase-1
MKTTLLLDADIIAYKFAATAEETVEFDEGQKLKIVSPDEVITSFMKSYIDELVTNLKADDFIVCLSCPSAENFRLGIYPEYKSNRKDLVRPERLAYCREWLASTYADKVYLRPTLEADDVMGILSTAKIIKGRKIIVSEDKDLQQIPGYLFNPRKDEKPRKISEEQGDYYFYTQVLTGDPTDGYKGLPGIGAKKAEKILAEAEDTYWEAIVKAYESKGLTEEDALVQARVARICRAEDYDFKNKEVKLWQPK